MGYSTDFTGQINIDPPLNQSEVDYLTKFSWTRHMKRQQGPYFVVDDMNNCEDATGVINFNEPHTPQPSLKPGMDAGRPRRFKPWRSDPIRHASSGCESA